MEENYDVNDAIQYLSLLKKSGLNLTDKFNLSSSRDMKIFKGVLGEIIKEQITDNTRSKEQDVCKKRKLKWKD